jgi:peptidoglycan/LPS O-acetylase OafA/YrhL
LDQATNSRFLWLDFLRGAAAIGVLSFHVVAPTSFTQISGFYVLVDFFFVLSGFVLWPSVPHERKTLARDGSRFMLQRFIRLWPMLIFALLVSNFIYFAQQYWDHSHHLFSNPDSNHHWTLLLAALAFLQVIVSQSMFMVVPLWSLSAEWLTNIVYIPLTAIKGNKGLLRGIFFGYALLNIGLTMDGGWISFIGPIRGAEALGRAFIGFGIGLLLRKNLDRLKKFQHPLLLLISGYGVYWSLFSNQHFGYSNCYFVVFIYAFFILQVVRYEINPRSAIGKFARSLGKYSYGIYVYHQIMIDLTKYVVKMPRVDSLPNKYLHYFIEKSSVVCFLAIAFTFITQKIFEGPIQRLAKRKIRLLSEV